MASRRKSKMTSERIYKLILAGIKEKDVDLVEEVLDADKRGARDLAAVGCFQALHQALLWDQEKIAHLLLDHAEKVFQEEAINIQTAKTRALRCAVARNLASIAKRLISERKVSVNDDLLKHAFQMEIADIIKMLIDAGCCPQSVLEHCEYICIDFKDLGGENRKVWEVLLPYWTPEGVMQSNLLESFIGKHRGGQMLQLLDELGMAFYPCVSSCGTTATKCMQSALRHQDSGAVQFLLDRDFNVNAYFDSKPILIHLVQMFTGYTLHTYDVILNAIKRGANPLHKNSNGENTIDVCICKIHHGRSRSVRSGCGRILNLLIYIGFRHRKTQLNAIPTNEDDVISNAIIENSLVPSLQNLCRLEIRLAKQRTDCVNQLQYPQKLKDLILLKDINFEEFKISFPSFSFDDSGEDDDE